MRCLNTFQQEDAHCFMTKKCKCQQGANEFKYFNLCVIIMYVNEKLPAWRKTWEIPSHKNKEHFVRYYINNTINIIQQEMLFQITYI